MTPVFAAVVFFATLAMRARVLMSPDIYLHIAVGRWIYAHKSAPSHGVLSGTMSDAPWQAHEWLASLGMSSLFDHFGWNGLLFATAALLALAIGIVVFEIDRAAGPVPAAICGFFAWGLCVGHLQARPHMASLPLFAFWIAAHARARGENRAPSLYVALLMIPWVNLHGGFVIAPIFTLLFAAEAMYSTDSTQWMASVARPWGLFLILTIGACLVSPYGVEALLFPFRLINMTSALSGVAEWRPSSLANNPSLFIAVLFFIAAAFILKLRTTITRAAMLLTLLYMAFAHVRYSELLGLAAPLLLLEAIALVRFRASESELDDDLKFDWNAIAVALRVLLGGVAATSLALFSMSPTRGGDSYAPEAALDWAMLHNVDGQVLNAYNFGGYLMYRGIPPFIDGRVELYGEDFIARYFAPDQLANLLDEYRIRWTILEPQNPRNVVLDGLPGWRRIYADDRAQIHARE